MKKSLIALAFGTLALGIAEFTMMGILPYVAADLGISIPVAGHFISAYALGVCGGAPILILARKCPLKKILLALVALVVIGNLCAAVSPNPWCSAILMALCTAGLFAVSSPEQVLIIRVAPGGEMLGGACVQIAFNLGNAIGAYAGGLAVAHDYRYPALLGVPFALIGFLLFLTFYKKYQSQY